MSNKVIFDESIDNFLNGFIDKTATTQIKRPAFFNAIKPPEFLNAININ